jgi:hypothetical protein
VGRDLPPALARAAALTLALALPVAFAGTTFLVVPTTAGLWRGLADPPSILRVAAALAVGALATAALFRWRPDGWPAARPLLVGLVAGLPLIPVLTGRGVLLLAFAWPFARLLLLAAAGVVLVRLGMRPSLDGTRGAVIAASIVSAAYMLLGLGWPGPAGPQGDEPHYLTMTESLLRDGDVDVRNQMEERAYAAFYSGTLAPHVSSASPPGHEYLIHSPGLSVLLLPAYALGGYAGARLFMALLAAVTAGLVHRYAREVSGSDTVAVTALAAVAFTPPLAFYSAVLYPEVPVALAAAILLLAGRPQATRGWHVAAIAAAVVVPWLHPKYLPMAAVGLALTLRRDARLRSVLAALSLAASVAALLLFMQAHYGRASLSAAYGAGFGGDVAPGRAFWGAPALLFDRQFGLFAVAPLWMLAIPGAALLWPRTRVDLVRATLVAGSAFGVNACFSMWWGGTCPPARFLVPCLPALAVLVALAAERRPALAAALIGAGLGVVVLAAEAPRALHNRADGESALLRVMARGLDLDRFLPSFVLEEPTALLLSVSLLAVFALAWLAGGRGLLAGVIGYAALVLGLRPGTSLDPRGATMALIDGYDDRALVAVSGPVQPETLRVPLVLPDAPWSFTEGVVRRSRPLDLPAGRYHIEAEGVIVEALPTAHVVRLDLLADEERIGRTYLEDKRPPPSFDVDLRAGARRLVIEATGIQGTGRISAATVTPRELLSRRERARR